MCLAQVLGMAGFMTYPSLLPELQVLWQMSNTEAGWINAVFFLGYLTAVAILTSLTDRIDARRIYLWSMALSAISLFGFAWAASDVASASLWRGLQGIGMAGTYMPGLRALTDRVPERMLSRAVAFYTAHFVVGSSLSILVAGEVAPRLGWQATFAVAGAGPIVAWLLTFAVLTPKPVTVAADAARRLLDFRPVFRNRRAIGYTAAYAVHCWELFGLRGWMVAFLAFGLGSAASDAAGAGWSPTHIATLMALVGLPASILGNEVAEKFGRRGTAVGFMLLSAALAVLVGLTGTAAPVLMVTMMLLYGATTMSESSVLTAGTVAAAKPDQLGATMAVHSLIGFSGSFMGPFVFGVMLDAGGGETQSGAWFLGFLSLGFAVATGPLFLLSRWARKDGPS